MRNIFVSIGLFMGMFTATAAFAEPAVQPGETLESLSQVKVHTTVNGQPGSLADLMSSGKYTPVPTPQPAADHNNSPAATPDTPASTPAP
ncbi:hypothetical protein [Acinetobacter brisouii]|uniref:hypothetical protein n=1 Tax=Acinetobacter brisouii TaxID=396323 RepID=UPI0005F86BEC|nr:hypothetical protein VH98_04490 [Acinetobacter brisouii]